MQTKHPLSFPYGSLAVLIAATTAGCFSDRKDDAQSTWANPPPANEPTVPGRGSQDDLRPSIAPEGASSWFRTPTTTPETRPERGDVIWAHGLGGPLDERTSGLHVDADDSILLGADFHDLADFGLGRISSEGGSDMAVAQYDENGSCLWQASLGAGSNDDSLRSVTLAPWGDLLVAGQFGGGSFGAETHPVSEYESEYADGFVASYDADGELLWDYAEGEEALTGVRAIATDEGGFVYALSIRYVSGETTARLTKLSPEGEVLWVESFRATEASSAGGAGLVVDRNGDLIVSFAQPMSETGGPDNVYGIVIAKVSPSGETQWVVPVQDMFQPHDGGLALDGDNGVVFTGVGYGCSYIGGDTHCVSSGVDGLGVIAKLSSDGQPVWSRRIEGYGIAWSNAIVPGSNGVFWIGGAFIGTLELSGITLLSSSGDSPDGFVAVVGPSGEFQWATTVAGPGRDEVTHLALDTQGRPVVAGTFEGSITVGDAEITGEGGRDVFLMELTP